VFGAIACFSGAFGTLLLRSARAQRLLNRVAGVVFLGLAVRLATAQR
jgi:threonine/homoserine/homoserine lactone efflux protein